MLYITLTRGLAVCLLLTDPEMLTVLYSSWLSVIYLTLIGRFDVHLLLTGPGVLTVLYSSLDDCAVLNFD